MSDLLRRCETFDWHGRDECSLIFICIGEACEHTRVRSARSHYVYADARPRDFQCGGLSHSFHRMFTRHVNRSSWSADASIGRRNIDYAPAALRQHHAQLVLHAEQRAEYVGVESRSIAFGGLLRDGAGLAFGTGVVDGNIEAAEALDGLIDQLAHIVVTAHVGAPILRLSADVAEFRD